jgi:cytochrome P450
MNIAVGAAVRPAHIPDDLVRDFDLYNLPGLKDGHSDDIHALWKWVQDAYPDMFWTPHNGGHWICTRYQEIVQLTTMPERYSSEGLFVPLGLFPYTGPPEMDAPVHMPFRKLVSLAFTPASLNRAGIRARAAAAEIVERLRPLGRCNFMRDFAGVMPIVTFLNLLGMPESEAEYLRDLASRMVPGQESTEAAHEETYDYIRGLIRERTTSPGDDFVSMLVHARIMDRELTAEERHAIVQLVVTGGLDTVINMTGFAMTHFARNPSIQQDLRMHSEVHDGAVEEITRRFGTSNLGRIVRTDCDLAGVDLKAGDQVLGVYPLAGLDERVNPDPMTFDPRRKGRKHLNFGSGPHTCLGARLARREIRVFIDEWIARMPDCRIAEGSVPKMATGVINYMHDLHLEWDPT